MLIGRRGVRETVDALLQEAQDGSSGALVVIGEPGIGKSALLGYARERAAGMQVVSTTGVGTEATVAFGGLLELVRPLRHLLAEIPAPQAEALASALSLGPPAAADRFTVSAGVLSLLSRAAEECPLLVSIDDAQWVDQPSLEALLFATRRLGQERIATVVAAREDFALTPDLPGTRLHLRGLDSAEVLQLLDGHGRAVAPEVAERLAAATGGNPLALIEISSLLSPEQLAGVRSLPDPLPAGTAEQALLRHVDGLGDAERGALLLVAVAGSAALPVLERAMHVAGRSLTLLDLAESADLISRRDGRLTFRHPLLRSAVYHAANPAERRTAHRAVAAAFAEAGDTGSQAGHLAAAATGPSEEVAELLVRSAHDARHRAGYSVASEAFERAARLTPQPQMAARRLVEAAQVAMLAGQPARASRLLDDALTDADEPLRAEIHYARANVQVVVGNPLDAYRLLTSAAARYESSDPNTSARLLTAAAMACFPPGRINHAVQAAQRGHQLASDPAVAQAGLFVLASAMVLAGEVALARKLIGALDTETLRSSVSDWEQLYPLAQLCTWIDEPDKARVIAAGTIAAARARSVLAGLPYMLAVLSELDLRQGDWVGARVNGVEAVELAEQTDHRAILPFGLVTLGRLEAAQGNAEQARQLADRAVDVAQELGVDSIFTYAGSLLALLELGMGNPAAAVAHLEPVRSRLQSMGMHHPNVVPWGADLVEAYLRAGREQDARQFLAEFRQVAQRTDSPWAKAAAARCTGLLTDGNDQVPSLEEALRLHGACSNPFEEARTRLCLGEALRTMGQQVRAGAELRRALAVFDQLGARPWAEAARRELQRCGERVTAPLETPVARLTAQELKVALAVAQGATNKQAAQTLFLSPKTVEFHLGNVYHKLGLRSRAQLVRYWHSEVVGAPVSAP